MKVGAACVRVVEHVVLCACVDICMECVPVAELVMLDVSGEKWEWC